MAVVHQQLSILLPRLLTLKDHSPFILVVEDILQTSYYFMKEFLHQIPKDTTNTILLRMEDFSMDGFQFDHTIEFTEEKNLQSIVMKTNACLVENKKNVVLIDCLNQIPVDELTSFLLGLLRPNCTLVGIYNESLKIYEEIPELSRETYYPKADTLLEYFSTTKIVLEPSIEPANTKSRAELQKLIEERHAESLAFSMPLNCNMSTFWAELEHRRRSGRSMKAKFSICAETHSIQYLKPEVTEKREPEEDPSLLEGLATFNLKTTEEQKKAKDQVMLPYLQAQELGNGGAAGGAIVYEFEKDDDYDEEDPYEDPF